METSVTVVDVPKSVGILRPIIKPDELIEAQNEVAQLIVKALKRGVDYGQVPGTRGKDTLLKPGAERIQKAFGCHTTFDVVEQEVDHDRQVEWSKYNKAGKSTGLYRYVVKATVISPHGQAVGSGLGSCSSLESKYIDRPRDVENTILKMAQKRAKVAATLDAFGLSDRFTQDLEDTAPDEQAGKASDAKTVEIYSGTPTELAALKGYLNNQGVHVDKHAAISEAMLGRPKSEISQVIKEKK